MGNSEECDPLLGPTLATLQQAEVSILEGEESDGGATRFMAGHARGGKRTNSKGTMRFSIRVAEPDPEPAGPDGGWGWVVCLAAFYCISILDG